MIVKPKACVGDLYQVPDNGKAELVNGELVPMSPTGGKPGRASGKIYSSLLQHEETHGGGYAFPDNVGFIVDLPNRQSFSPDAAWYTGTTIDMKFLQGAPAFAVEVRGEDGYGPAAERALAAKITDYFTAGTLVVWDVDLLGANVVRKYIAVDPTRPAIYRATDLVDAEPAVPGWQFEVGKLLR